MPRREPWPQAPLLIDIAGPELRKRDRRRLKHPAVGGVVLFGRHWVDRAQLTQLCADIKDVRADLLITVDHEGGRVQRFATDGFTPLPAARWLGERWMQDPLAAQDAASALGFVLAAELRACGVDLSFAPVLDLDHGPSGVIGDRSLHRDARVVTMLAKSITHGMLRAGMGHCGKHFPGHGFAAADSHHAVPVDDRPLDAILADDAAPYGWLGSTLVGVMAAHVVYPQVDARPAGYSDRWLRDVLRGHLGFTGAVFTDDLSMAGARAVEGRAIGLPEAVLAALGAGCDLALVCNQSLVDDGRPIDELLEAMDQALFDACWRPDAEGEARRLALLPRSAPLGWDDLMRSAEYGAALDKLA